MATDLNVAELLEISKVEGLDGKVVLQSIGGGDGIAHGDDDNKETHGDASYVFVDDPSVQPESQTQEIVVDHVDLKSLTHQAEVEVDHKTTLTSTEGEAAKDDSHGANIADKCEPENKPAPHSLESDPNQLASEEEKLPQVAPSVQPHLQHAEEKADRPELVSVEEHQEPVIEFTSISEAAPGAEKAEVKVNQDNSVSDVLVEENTKPVLVDMDISKADSNQPHPEENTQQLQDVVEAVESDLHRFTHGEDKVDQDKSTSDVIQEKSKEAGRDISEADSNQLDPEEEKQLPKAVEVVEPDSHRLTHGEENAGQDSSVSGVKVEESKEPVLVMTDINEIDSKYPNLEEKFKEENKELLPEVAEAAKSDSHQLARGEDKADEDKSVSDVIIEENKELAIETIHNSEVDSNHPNFDAKAEEEKKLPEVAEAVESVSTHGKAKLNHDKSDPDVVGEHKEPVIEAMQIVESESNRSTPEEEKVEDKRQVPEIVEAVQSDLHQLAHGEEKVADQAKFDRESESIESQVVISQVDVIDSLDKSELHQPYDGGNKVGEISEVGAHEEAHENQSSQLPIMEACESEPRQVCIEEETGEQNKLESSGAHQDTQISTSGAAESEPSLSDDVKECNRGTLLDKIPTSEPSKHLETENVESEMITCPSADLQVEVEAKSRTDEDIGDLTTIAVEDTVLQAEILNVSDEDNKKSSTCTIGENELEPQSAKEHVQNTGTSVFKMKPETDLEDTSAERGEGFSTSYDVRENPESEAAEDFVNRHESTSPVEGLKSETQLGNGPVEGNQSTEAIASHEMDGETNATDGFTRSTNLSADPADDTESKSEAGISSSESLKLSATDTAKLESLISCGPVISGESIEGVCVDRNGKSMHEGNGIEEIYTNGSPSLLAENSTIGSLGGANVDSEVEKKPFRFLIRIPRYNDDKIRSQIDLAQKKVEEKTRDRDAIRSTIQSRRAICGEYRDTFEAARSEERAARDALNVKRREMDTVLSAINRKKNANSVEDIDDRIRIMEHRIEHETVPLKEEKLLIREIKQMKSLRVQLSSTLGQQAEHEPTSEERVNLEERHRPLKQEIEQCRRELSRLEGITKDAWKIHFNENEKLKELQAQFRTADDLRQEAYIELQNLKKQLYEKNKYFRMYKEDSWKAEDYSSKGDREGLHNLCVNQVERIMELWNKNDEFRNEYIRCNTMSTLRRLRTLDGRSLGPDEEPPLLRNGLDERVDNSLVGSANKVEFPSLSSSQGNSVARDIPSVENLGQRNHKVDSKSLLHLEQKNLKADSKSVLNLEEIHPIAKSNKITKSAGLENISKVVSGSDEKQDNVEENKLAMEEEILARKEEELRKEKEAAKLKEQRRLEEKAKAKEAEERKRRNAEKAQARAELRAQKEAELREKERERKVRKKERKMAEGTTGVNATESSSRVQSSQPETAQEPEVKEKPKTVGKRSQKPALLAKQIKPKVVPPPLRNRNKKRIQQWMWIILLIVVVMALFLLGNIGFSLKFGWSSFSF